jgi:hypothetical protein
MVAFIEAALIQSMLMEANAVTVIGRAAIREAHSGEDSIDLKRR